LRVSAAAAAAARTLVVYFLHSAIVACAQKISLSVFAAEGKLLIWDAPARNMSAFVGATDVLVGIPKTSSIFLHSRFGGFCSDRTPFQVQIARLVHCLPMIDSIIDTRYPCTLRHGCIFHRGEVNCLSPRHLPRNH